MRVYTSTGWMLCLVGAAGLSMRALAQGNGEIPHTLALANQPGRPDNMEWVSLTNHDTSGLVAYV